MKDRDRRALTAVQLLFAACSLGFADVGDPLSTAPDWTADGDQEVACFGTAVAGGDVNGDGFADLVVGAPNFDTSSEGRVSLYLGSASGLSLTPAWTLESDLPSSLLGSSVGAADVNGDGFDDLIISEPFEGGEAGEGRALLFLGSASGPTLVPSWVAESDRADARFVSVSGAGDVNGDGFDEVIVGAPYLSDGELREGGAFLYLGSAAGPSMAPDWTLTADQADAQLGNSVAGAGDVNGDGFDDVIVGARLFEDGEAEEGHAFLFLGSSAGLSLAPDWTVQGGQVNARLGVVAGAGDVNGDGFDDVIVGAPSFHHGASGEGRATLYLGSASGPSLAADWTIEGGQTGASFGRSVAGAGDVDGDGFDDVIVGAPHFNNGQTDEGKAFLYRGSSGGLSLAPSWRAEGNQQIADFASSVTGAGDVNGDGFDDVAVGAPFYDTVFGADGRAFLYHGQAVPKPIGTSYCVSTVNSSGGMALISATGSELAADEEVTLRTEGCPAAVTGLYFFGTTSSSVPFGDGFRCAGGAIRRIHPAVQSTLGGAANRALAFAAPYASSIVAGADLRFQLWFRDSAAGMSGFNLSNGVRIAFQ